MHSIKVFLSVGSLAAGSLAQSFSSDPSCLSSLAALGAAAPSIAPYLQAILPDPASILADPSGYASGLCAAASNLPASELSGFASYGQALLSFASAEISSYDALVTKCFATGDVAAAATSYIHSIISQTDPLCQVTSAPGTGHGPSNGTATITSPPTPTASTNSTITKTSPSTSPIATALATKPTGVLAGAVGVASFLAAVALL